MVLEFIFGKNINNVDNVENIENEEIKNTNKNIFDRNTSILQGMYIRDVIKIPNIVHKIFKNKMKMKIEFQIWDLEKYDFFSQSTKKNNKINKYVSTKLKQLKNNKTYFIYISIYNHVNLIYIDLKDNNKIYYLYEPHIPDDNDDSYPIPKRLNDIFSNFDFQKKNFPAYVLKQNQLPLCYMYIMHFFLNLYYFENTEIYKKNIIDNYDDDIIIEFTEWMLESCFQEKMIRPKDYYLLTNKICQYNLFCKNYYNHNIFVRSCNPRVIVSFFINYNQIKIDFSHIHKIYSDNINFYYMHKFFELTKINDMSFYNKHQIFILSILMKYYYNIDHSINVLSNSDIDQEILVEIIKESDILSQNIGYDFFYNILKYVKTYKDKKILIQRFLINDHDKEKCTQNLINYLGIINSSYDYEPIAMFGVRRQRGESN